MGFAGHFSEIRQWREDQKDYAIAVQRRSATLSEGQGLLTIIPEAFHQPMIDTAQEMPLRSTFFREVFEELFGGEETTEKVRRLTPDWYIADSEPLQWLEANPDKYDLMLTGAGINLVSGNYEFALFCRIHSGEFWRKFSHELRANWETGKDITPLLSSRDPEISTRVLLDKTWNSVGLYSFARGLLELKRFHRDAASGVEIEEVEG